VSERKASLDRLKAALRRARSAAGDETIPQRRARMDAGASSDLPDGVRVEETHLGGLQCVVVTTAAGRSTPGTWLHCHGGGFVAGSPTTHRAMAGVLAPASGMAVALPDYPLAPEHPWPAGPQACRAAAMALAASGQPWVLSGDSAGGWLALDAALALREAGASGPQALVLMSPWLDLAVAGPNLAALTGQDPVLEPEGLRVMGRLFDPQGRAPALLGADLSGLPPVLIQAASDEIVLDDARALDAAACAADVETTLSVWDDLFHGFQMFAPRLPEAVSALHEAAAFAAASQRGRLA
jgi:epsilon-lactone hydrolase